MHHPYTKLCEMLKIQVIIKFNHFKRFFKLCFLNDLFKKIVELFVTFQRAKMFPRSASLRNTNTVI